MTDFINQSINYLTSLAAVIPVELFMLIGGLIEEIIAPIPSPFVATLAGSIAAANGAPLIYLLVLAILGAISKTFASWIIYRVADKAEDIVLTKFGKLLGVSHHQIEKLGSKLDKTSNEKWLLIALRALPIIPSAPVSVICGLIKINLKVFLVSSFIGFTIKIFFYLYIGFSGLDAYKNILSGLDSAEKIFKVVVLFIIGLSLAGMYYYRFIKRTKS